MDFGQILKRAFRITIKYRPLWLFGFFMALCSASGNFSSPGSGTSNSYGSDTPLDLPPSLLNPSPEVLTALAAVILGLCCLALIAMVVGTVVRLVSQAAIIGMVNQIEEESQTSVKDGWRFGWSAAAWKIFLIQIIIGVPMTIVVLVLALPMVVPFLMMAGGDEAMLVLGILLFIGYILIFIALMLLISFLVAPLSELSWRYAVLQQLGAFSSLQASFNLVRSNVKSVLLTMLILFGVGLAWGIVMFFVVIVLLLIAGVVAAIPGLLVYAFTEAFWAAALAAAPLFMLIFMLPMLFVSGLFLVFNSAVWTLVFRDLQDPPATDSTETAPPAPLLDEPKLDEPTIVSESDDAALPADAAETLYAPPIEPGVAFEDDAPVIVESTATPLEAPDDDAAQTVVGVVAADDTTSDHPADDAETPADDAETPADDDDPDHKDDNVIIF